MRENGIGRNFVALLDKAEATSTLEQKTHRKAQLRSVSGVKVHASVETRHMSGDIRDVYYRYLDR